MRTKTRRFRIARLIWLWFWVCLLLFWSRTQLSTGVVNRGGVLGLFEGAWWWLLVVWGVLGYMIFMWWRTEGTLLAWGMSFILVGGMANAVERGVYGGVVDYIYYPFLGVYGNMADILLGVGVIALLWGQRASLRRKHD